MSHKEGAAIFAMFVVTFIGLNDDVPFHTAHAPFADGLRKKVERNFRRRRGVPALSPEFNPWKSLVRTAKRRTPEGSWVNRR